MRRLTFLAAAAVLFAVGVVPAAAQTDQGDPGGSVFITALHAISADDDFPADVYLNGELAIAGFTMMMRTEPFELAPGPVDVAVFAAGADPSTAVPAIEQTITLSDPGYYVLVAQLTDAGNPILAVYTNDLSAIPMGQGRFVFRQTSVSGPVDVSVGGEVIATDLGNSGEAVADLAAGVHEVTVTPASGGDPLLVDEVELIEGELTAVFAISHADGGLELAVVTIAGLQSVPAMVQTGTGGLSGTGSKTTPIVLIFTALLIFGSAVTLRSARTR